jgi:prolyl oligopeptidase PreP (S9A serine peptidase family)
MSPLARLLAFAAACALLAACAQAPIGPSAPSPVSAAATFAPNANLLAQGIPPIPQALVDRVQAYTDFRGHTFVDWHPVQRQMLVAHRKSGDNIAQLYLLRAPLAELEQITNETEPVTSALFEPREGRYLVFERSQGGNEAAQVYRQDLDTRQTTLLTDPSERHDIVGWLNRSSQLIYSSVPLDRTADGGRRSEITTTYWLIDPLQPTQRRKLAELPGGGWWGSDVSRDDRYLALTNYISAGESHIWLLDLANGQRRQWLPAAGEVSRSAHFSGNFSPDGKTLFFTSTRAGEFREAMLLELTSGQIRRLSAHVPWDVGGATFTRDGKLAALQFNVDGRDELRLFDASGDFAELPAPRLPAGSVGSAQFHPARAELAFSLNGAQGPSQLYSWGADGGRVQQWTRALAAPGVDMSSFSDSQVVRWKSFDGRSISGLLNLPPPRFEGKRPVLIDIHGGPEAQATVGFLGRYNYLINELGIAILQPNVRGSSGFGKTFLTLDDGMKREDSVKDIGALLDWIATQPNLDASRVMVSGASYGGYMSLAVSTHHADRIAGAIDDVGISNFVTFLTNTESYRRDLRRVEYGDERDPAMREFLERISPLTNAHKITKPLFVIQGKNDPRVPVTEAEQIVERVRLNGTPVWYLRGENEGHGFARKENADFRFYAMVRFIETVLLDQP